MGQNEALKNPRVIIIQKLYGHHINKDSEITYSKHSEFLSFINSGGVIAKTFYIPLNDFLNKFVIKIDNLITKLDKIFAMQKCIVLKKIDN